MSDKPSLLFLHGVGTGDMEDTWRAALEEALTGVGYHGLDDVTVIAPKYPSSLIASDDDFPLPALTVKAPTNDHAKKNRREFDRRESSIEIMLGRHDPGADWILGEPITDVALRTTAFRQAANYLKKPRVRANVLTRVLSQVPPSGRLVIVGHSLGSVIAADLVRRLPTGVDVVGIVTIGSPLSSSTFHVEGLRDQLKEPPTNLGWWVGFWNPLDPVTTHRGVSSVFPWMTDYRVPTRANTKVHSAATYLDDPLVARAIGYALHGSQSKELVVARRGLDIPVDAPETLVLLALRYAFLTKTKLDGARQERYADALRQVQSETIRALEERRERENRPLPAAIGRLAIDLTDPKSVAPEPGRISHVSKDEGVLPLISLMSANVIRPYEISVASDTRTEALEDLTIEMGLGRQYARDIVAAGDAARKALSDDGTNWVKWAAMGVGAVALVVATGGLALSAAPGVAGAAAITSALAAFGPGGMIGGLLTAGTLVGAGGGGVAFGLASPAASAEAVEAFVSTQLAAAILRKKQGLEQDTSTWTDLAQTGIALRRERARLEPISDESAPTLSEIGRKLKAIDRALVYLSTIGLGPTEANAPDVKMSAAEFLDRAADAFRSVDIDGDGIPDRPRARVAVDEASSAVKDAATGARSAVASRLRRRRADAGEAADPNSEPSQSRDSADPE